MYFKTLLCYSMHLFIKVQSANILAVFPFPSISHQVVFRTLTNELIRKGHEVTVITPDPEYLQGDAPSNLREIDVHDISYDAWRKLYMNKYDVKEDKEFTFTKMRSGSVLTSHLFEIQLQTPEVQELITNKSNKFDLLLVEGVIFEYFAYSQIFKAPIIMVSSLGAILKSDDIIGTTIHPLLYPSALQMKIYNLTLCEKLNILFRHYSFKFATYFNEADENAVIKRHLGRHIAPLNELYNNADMFFINIHPIWTDNQPVPPGFVYMGGIHQLTVRKLPEDLETYLDSSEYGVIYVSFGTNVLTSTIPVEKIQSMINVFCKLPYDVLWKWDNDELTGKSCNIRMSKWFPQSNILRHPKLKLFVTQAGLQSTYEAITGGVPLVSIPIYGDQWYNAEKYVKHGIGVKLDIETFNEVEFKNAVETVIGNESYRKNVVNLRTIIRDQKMPPLDRTMWWVEYILKHNGSKQLRAPEANISISDYLELELLLILVSMTLVTSTIIVMSLILLCRYIANLMYYKQNLKNE